MFRRICCSSVAVALVGLALISSPGSTQNAQSDAESTGSQIKALQIQRRDVLKERVDALTLDFNGGRSGISVLLDAELELIDAELELTSNKEGRIRLRKQAIERLQQLEKFAQLKLNTGTGTIQDRLGATAGLLRAKVELLREQGSE